MILLSKDRLFRKNSDASQQAPARWVDVQSAYSKSGLLLLDAFQRRRPSKAADLYPALFLCRHAVELDLKAIVAMSFVADRSPGLQAKLEKLFKIHDLKRLWALLENCGVIKALRTATIRDEHPIAALLDQVKLCVDDFCSIDPSSTVFRYPVGKQLESYDFSALSISNFMRVYPRLMKTLQLIRQTMDKIVEGHSDPSLGYLPRPMEMSRGAIIHEAVSTLMLRTGHLDELEAEEFANEVVELTYDENADT